MSYRTCYTKLNFDFPYVSSISLRRDSYMVIRFGLIIRIVQANFTNLGEKLLGDSGKYRVELITNLFKLLIIACPLILHWKNVVLNIYGI